MGKYGFYAVARGRRTGIFTNGGEAQKQVQGFKGGLLRGFNSRAEAEHFLATNRVGSTPAAAPVRAPVRALVGGPVRAPAPVFRTYVPPCPFQRPLVTATPSHSTLLKMAEADNGTNKQAKKKRYSYYEDPSDKFDKEEPYIVCAAAAGYINVVKQLLSMGVSVDRARRWEEIDYKAGGMYSKEWTWDADTPLAAAIKKRQLKMVQFLASKGACTTKSICVTEDEHYTPRQLVEKITDPEERAKYVDALAGRAYVEEHPNISDDDDDDDESSGSGEESDADDGQGAGTQRRRASKPSQAEENNYEEQMAFKQQAFYRKNLSILSSNPKSDAVATMRPIVALFCTEPTAKMPKPECKQLIADKQKAILEDPNQIPFEYYSKVTAAVLKNWCRAAGLAVGGNKDQLESRLASYRSKPGHRIELIPEDAEEMALTQQRSKKSKLAGIPAELADALPEAYTNHEQPPGGRRELMTDPRYCSSQCREALAGCGSPSSLSVTELHRVIELLPKYAISLEWETSGMSTKANYVERARAQILRIGVENAPYPLEDATTDELKAFLKSCHLRVTGKKDELIKYAKEFIFYHGYAANESRWKAMPLLAGFAPMKQGIRSRTTGMSYSSSQRGAFSHNYTGRRRGYGGGGYGDFDLDFY